jgi:hypothetical protein
LQWRRKFRSGAAQACNGVGNSAAERRRLAMSSEIPQHRRQFRNGVERARNDGEPAVLAQGLPQASRLTG